jgi:hypothetical protein
MHMAEDETRPIDRDRQMRYRILMLVLPGIVGSCCC